MAAQVRTVLQSGEERREFDDSLISQVALKRQQAAEDALALNMRSVASGENIHQLPEGPIIGLPCPGGVKHNESNAERRIKGETEDLSLIQLDDCSVFLQRSPSTARPGQSDRRGSPPPPSHPRLYFDLQACRTATRRRRTWRT